MTAAALGATAYSRMLGRRAEEAASETPGGAPSANSELEDTSRKLRVAQWAVPALTGVLVVLNALHGEQQKAGQQKLGFMRTMGSRLGWNMACARRVGRHSRGGAAPPVFRTGRSRRGRYLRLRTRCRGRVGG